MPQLPIAAMRPARPVLWTAALRMAADHPVFGVGPDNYRLAYGPYAGIARWDRRVHANNMYLEILAGAGSVGLLALLWLLGSTAWHLWRRLERAQGAHHIASAVMVAVWLVVAGHGLVDSFLSFTTTYVSFALATGVAFSAAFDSPELAHADRI